MHYTILYVIIIDKFIYGNNTTITSTRLLFVEFMSSTDIDRFETTDEYDTYLRASGTPFLSNCANCNENQSRKFIYENNTVVFCVCIYKYI